MTVKKSYRLGAVLKRGLPVNAGTGTARLQLTPWAAKIPKRTVLIR